MFKRKLIEIAAKQFGPLDQLILQSTSFCNLNCTYCYLPNRDSMAKMSREVLESVAKRILNSKVIPVSPNLEIVWHAGEPLALPPSFYAEAMRIFKTAGPESLNLKYSFQSNGTLITAEWIRFLVENKDTQIGLSIDGPETVHNKSRVNRRGRGSFQKAIEGYRRLREVDIQPFVISVVSRHSLLRAEELYDFYRNEGITSIGLNFEESEGINAVSSLSQMTSLSRIQFLKKFFTLVLKNPFPLRVREVDAFLDGLRGNKESLAGNQMNSPFRIVTVATNGGFSTFSPELIGQKSDQFKNFEFGNILNQDLESALLNEAFAELHTQIVKGVKACRSSCASFASCGGGAPSEKIAEFHSAAVSETSNCQRAIKQPQQILKSLFESLEVRNPLYRHTFLTEKKISQG